MATPCFAISFLLQPATPDPTQTQTLFFWAEFMAEVPVKPRGRSREPQPASLSNAAIQALARSLDFRRTADTVYFWASDGRRRGRPRKNLVA